MERATVKALLVAFFSFFAVPLLEWLRYTSEMDDPWMVFLSGLFFAFFCVSVVCYVLLHFFPSDLTHILDRIYYYVFCVFAFTAIVDLEIGMTLAGWIGSVEFYLHTGEPYLKSSYGSFINWWDGTFHWALYIYMTYLLTKNKGTLSDRVRGPGMIWVGSIMNSLVVFLPGNIAGKFGSELKWSYLLNVPYALFPMLFVVRLFGQSSPLDNPTTPSKAKKGSFLSRCYDYVLALLFVASSFLAFFRLFAALNSPVEGIRWWKNEVEPYLGDPTLYPLLQCAVFVAYFVPFYLYAIRFLIEGNPPSQRMIDWTGLYLGASLQAQFSYVGPALHNIPTYPEPTWRPIPTDGLSYFSAAHSLLTLLPILLWFRVWSAIPSGPKKEKKK